MWETSVKTLLWGEKKKILYFSLSKPELAVA